MQAQLILGEARGRAPGGAAAGVAAGHGALGGSNGGLFHTISASCPQHVHTLVAPIHTVSTPYSRRIHALCIFFLKTHPIRRFEKHHILLSNLPHTFPFPFLCIRFEIISIRLRRANNRPSKEEKVTSFDWRVECSPSGRLQRRRQVSRAV